MNVELFRKHLASRKIKPEPLRTGIIPLVLPPHISSGATTVMLDPCKVLAAEFGGNRELVILELEPSLAKLIHKRESSETDAEIRNDIRLSRFKRAYGGMLNPPIRVWTEDGERSNARITPGCIVKCGLTMRVSKGKAYFDLHRDIILVKGTKQSKRRKVEYFSDGDSE